MAAAMPSVFSTKLKLIQPNKSLIEGSKFIKWSEPTLNNDKSSPSQPTCVNLKVDEKCFILYWRDVNVKNLKSTTKELVEAAFKSFSNKYFTKSEFLDIALIRDVKTGNYANIPRDKNTCEILTSGKSGASIREKTVTIYYGPDFVNLQSINFVSLSDNAPETAKTWAQFLFQAAVNQRTQNLSPYENLLKLRTCLLYGKSVFDERTLEYKLPVQTIVDTFVVNNKQTNYENEKQEVLNALNYVNLPCGKYDMIDEKMLSVEKFFNLFLRLISKNINVEIAKIFSKYKAVSRKTWFLNDEKFEKFLNEEQRDPSLNELLYPFITTDKAGELIKKFEIDESYRKKKLLTYQGLIRYLMDFENEIIDPIKYELNEDMEQPMSHYFINSSHNTYLTGHQITGRSDPEMYRQVLLSGCRCIELDCHEDEGLDEPIITHGRTLCTKIPFSDVIHAIKETAFKTSPYPVLLSFENYCGKRMQEKMANYLIDILGDNLLKEPLLDYPLEPGVPLPSPEQLKYKILCKFRKKIKTNPNGNHKSDGSHSSFTKTPLKSQDSEAKINRLSSSSSAYFSNQLSHAENFLTQHSQSIVDDADNSDASDKEDKEDFLEIQTPSRNIAHRSAVKIKLTDSSSLGFNQIYSNSFKSHLNSLKSENSHLTYINNSNTYDMSSLVNYLTPTTFRSFEVSYKRNRTYEMSSFVETTAFNMHKEKPTEFVNYNKRQFSRIYPKGTRISSDNFIPQMFWNVGCQQVALNFQTLDLGMQLNLGKFEYNNKSGYILKPEIMRRADFNKPFDPFAESPLDGIVATTLSLQILNGIYLNGSRYDNDKRVGHLVIVELYGLPADSLRGQKAHRVKAASSGNTFFVNYNDDGFTFKKIIMPQLALLNITVQDEQGKLIGRRCLPVVGLRPGYRYICLKNESNQPINLCLLFVHIKLHDYVPEEYEEFASALVNPIDYVKSLDRKEEMLRRLQDENDAFENFDQDDNLFFEEIIESKEEVESKSNSTENSSNTITKKMDKIQSIPKINELLILSNPSENLLESIDLNKSELNNSDIMREINLNYLKTSDTYLQLSSKYFNKIDRIEHDLERKIYDLDQMLTNEIEKLHTDTRVKNESKTSRLKQLAKKTFMLGFPFSKGSYSPNTMTLSPSSSSLDSENYELSESILTLRQKYVKFMMNTYIDAFKEIYKLKIDSIDPLFNKLQLLIEETHQQRIKYLKTINEKETELINKTAHEEIKLKKKSVSQVISDKDDLQRIYKKIDKEAIGLAASLTEQSNDLLKNKLIKLTQMINNSLCNLNELKNKKLLIYKNELIVKINEKKQELEEAFFKDITSNVSTLSNIQIDIDYETISHDSDVKPVIHFKKNEKTHL